MLLKNCCVGLLVNPFLTMKTTYHWIPNIYFSSIIYRKYDALILQSIQIQMKIQRIQVGNNFLVVVLQHFIEAVHTHMVCVRDNYFCFSAFVCGCCRQIYISHPKKVAGRLMVMLSYFKSPFFIWAYYIPFILQAKTIHFSGSLCF